MALGELKEVIQGCGKAMEGTSKKRVKIKSTDRGVQRGWVLRE